MYFFLKQLKVIFYYVLQKTTVLHEVMHAIGMDHEQQRQDRDDYIQMFWNNILNGQNNHNMYKTQTADRNAYDVESIMQYGLYSFAINNTAKTMKLLDSRLEFLVDSAKALTFYDVKDITAGYNCTQNCTSTNTPVCTNEGFLGHTCQCFCPPGLRGTTCQNVTTDSDCGGVITLSSGGSHVIESPNYPNNHTLDKVCVWLIKTPQGTNVSLTINEMDLRYDEEETRCYHWLEMRYNLLGQSGPKKCGVVNSTTSDISSSRSNLMMLRFDSRFSKDISAYKGFRLTVSIQGDKEVQPCDSSPCQNGGTCSNNANGNTFTCSCATGWSGPTCTGKYKNK
ncbi:hypothetical protein FSP39_018103 [Pinctada imbricata]|uniref:Metalloendopeptidase n=1 Tax=Pinctada imbricata TaxID=66713 RepID=A0AA88XX49_PINIB|nr:hypothetical protein FSP39_018103 [Pinctada imbricata]